MKRKLFKYKIVYWIALIVNVVVLFFYSTYLYSMVIDSLFEPKDKFIVLTSVIAGIFSIVSLFFLFKKNKYSISIYSIFLSLVLINLLITIFTVLYYRDSLTEVETLEDYTISLTIYMIFFGLIFLMVRLFRFKNDLSILEMDSIGTHND